MPKLKVYVTDLKRESSSYLSPYSAEKTAYGRLSLNNA